MRFKKVALIQGGMSSEREVSLSTGASFEKALKELKLDYVTIDAKEDLPDQLKKSNCDVALLALHGKYAEDGVVQGLLEYLKIPYTGSGVLASALCMSKVLTKQILQQNGVSTAEFQVVDLKRTSLDKVDIYLKAPVVVKPSREGSSVGITICKTNEEILPAIQFAGRYDHQVLVERFVKGPEITVPIFMGRALTPIEIVPKSNFYDYKNKYTAGQTDYYLPARVESGVIDELKKVSEKIYDVLNIRSYCRIDYIVEEQKPYVIEVNTLPGCTATSLLPKSAKFDGIAFNDLILQLIEDAGLDYEGLQ